MVWTGRELITWDGLGSKADGAVFDVRGGRWSDVAPGPLRARLRPAAAWSGQELLVWGGTLGSTPLDDGAAYDLESATWRMLPDAPIGARIPVAGIWTGRELLVWGDEARAAGTRDGAAYDPSSDTWRRIPDAPFALNQATAVWTGDEMIVVGATLDDRREAAAGAQAMAYDPAADRWHTLAKPPLWPQASTAAWVGRRLVAWDYLLGTASYDPAKDAWTRMQGPPLSASECYPSNAAAGGVVVGWYCGVGALYNTETGTWSKLEGPPGVDERPVAGGDVVFFTRRGDLEIFTP